MSEKKEKKEKKDKKDKKESKESKETSNDDKRHSRTAGVPTWSTPVILPGPVSPFDQTSTSAPILGTFGGTVFLAFRSASNDAIWVNSSSDGQTWLGNQSYEVQKSTGGTDPKIYTLYRPGLASSNGAFYLAYVNKGDSVMSLVSNSTPSTSTWNVLTSATIPATPISGPSIAPFTNGLLYLAYTDSNNRIQVGNYSSATGAWSTFSSVKDSGGVDFRTTDSPCLWSITSGSLTFRLYISFRYLSKIFIGYANFDSSGNITSWTAQNATLTPPFALIDSPQVTVYSNDFEMAVTGPNEDIRYGSSSNEGATWGDWGVMLNSCNGSPSIVQKGLLLVMAFSADSKNLNKTFVMTSYATFA